MESVEKEDLLIKEITAKYKVSRIMLQRYERIGLIKPTSKTKMGHLRYNNRMVTRILFIRFLQDCYFTLPEISELFKLDDNSMIERIDEQLKELEARRITLDKQIEKTAEILNRLKENDYTQIYDVMEEYK